MKNIKEELKKLDILQNARDSTISMLEKEVKLRTVRKGSHLFFDKDDVYSIYVLVNGCVALYKLNTLGEKKVIFIYKDSALINEVILQDIQASINCEVLKESTVLIIPRTVLLQAMEADFQVNKRVIDSMAVKIRRLYRQLKNTTNSMKGEKKIASKLWKLARDYGKPVNGEIYIDIEMSITYLANMLGSKRETVSKQLKLLCEEKLIRMERNRFYIIDEEKLKIFYDKL